MSETRLYPKNADPGSTEQRCGCFYDSEENSIYLCAAHDGREREELIAEVERLRGALSKQNAEIEQTLGKALGYPWFKDDQKNFPGATEADGVCVGEHVAESLAAEAAAKITNLRAATSAEAGKVVEVARELAGAAHHKFPGDVHKGQYIEFTKRWDSAREELDAALAAYDRAQAQGEAGRS